MPEPASAPADPTTPPTDEFYIGYAPKAPPAVARRTRLIVAAYVLFSMIIATVCVAFIKPTGDGVWEDGSFKSFTGTLLKKPYPIIILDKPLADGVGSTALLVDFGKRGAQQRVQSLSGRVRVTGTTLHRDGRGMIELAPDPDAIAELKSEAAILPSFARDITPVTLRGEIVDPKCFLGAMKPGEGKTHKACAIRCISGGIPPTLVCWDAQGNSTYFVLADESGNPACDLFLDVIGQPVEVTGTLARLGDLMFLLARRQDVHPL
ncbi:MAG: hypothetical protein AB7O77_04775 [Phycisphaerales bacterium]